MQAIGIILLLAAGIIVLFGTGGSFVPVHDPVAPIFNINVIAKDIS